MVHQPQQRHIQWLMDTLKSKVLAIQAGVLKWGCMYLQKTITCTCNLQINTMMQNKNTKNLNAPEREVYFLNYKLDTKWHGLKYVLYPSVQKWRKCFIYNND
jgi:hypothetical protein